MDSFCGGYWGLTASNEDKSLDPGWTDVVDFSTCFENLVLTSLPAGFLTIFGIIRIVYLLRTRPFTWLYPSGLFSVKQGINTLTAALVLAQLVYNIYVSAHGVLITSSAIMLYGTVFVTLLLHVEHNRGSRSSGMATSFWLLTLLVDCVRVRTAALQNEHGSYDTVFFAVLIMHLTLSFVALTASLFLEPAAPYSIQAEAEHVPSPEPHVPMLSWLSFWWINPLMALGYKRSLTTEDLWSINAEDETERLTHAFFKEWRQEESKAKPSLTSALGRAFGGPFYMAGVLKFGQDLLGFVGPILLSSIITFITDTSIPSWQGYAYAGLLLLAAEVQSLLLHQYFHRVMALGMRLRSAVIAAVYNKSLVLTASARQSTTTGEIVNLMAVDAQRFMDLTSYLHMMWSAPLQIGVSLFLLWSQMNYAVFGGVGVMLLMVPLNGYIARKSRQQQIAQMKQKDQRIKLMNEVLSGIKVIKLYGWEVPYRSFIDKIREKELKVLKDNSYINAVAMFSWSCAPFFVSLVTFLIYVLAIGDLTAEKAFVSLSLFNILRFPMTMLPMLISSLVEAQVSVNRLKKFLLLPEMHTGDIIRSPPRRPDGQPPAVAITVARGSFSWSTEAQPMLRDIDLTVSTGTLVAVVGQVGAGKSSLVSAMLGEMEKIAGNVVIPHSTAYVPQQAWIQNATLRDNVLFGRPYDPQRYAQVIAACALEADLAILPAGDMTEIGEKGINLSGGQKQRVSLARAVYHDSECYFLDDPLSAVDAHVGKHIFEHVIGPHGLLQSKTRVLVTHGVHFLPFTDRVVVLREGRVTEQGSYNELLAANGDFARFISEHVKEDTHKGEKDATESSTDPEGIESSKGAASAASATAAAAATAAAPTLRARGSSNAKKPLPGDKDKEDTDKSKLIAKEGVSEGDVKRQVYLSYFRANGYAMCIFILALYIGSFALQIGSSIWLTKWSEDSHPTRSEVGVYLGVYAALGLGNSLGILIVTLVSAASAVQASRALHNRLLTSIIRSPMLFFDTTPLGRIVNRVSKDVYAIDETIPRSFRSYISTLLQVLSIIVVICYSTWYFLAAVVPMGVLYYWIQRYYVATSRQLQRLESVSRSPIYALFSETLNGVTSIRAYGRQRSFTALNERKVDANMRAYYPSICANRWLALRLEFLGNMIVFFAALFAVVERDYGSINAAVVGLSLSYAMSVTQTLNWMVRMSSQLESDIVAVERVEEYIGLPSEAPLHTDHVPASAWPEQGRIAFESYGVRYRPGLDLVLRGINVDIQPGEKVGIVGRTGAGKSSLTLALFRIIEPALGRIVIDGEDIALLGLQDLRSHLTVMPQDPVLFCGSVRDNLDPFHVYEDNAIWMALQTCHLRDYIASLGQGLESPVSEGGENFSVGQRQLLCLARAVLRKTKVLVLDEATAAVDLETDQLIQRTIRTEFRACTVLTIAHRINTIMDNDRVLVLDKGEVVEFDTPANLLQRPDGIFRGMCVAAGIQ